MQLLKVFSGYLISCTRQCLFLSKIFIKWLHFFFVHSCKSLYVYQDGHDDSFLQAIHSCSSGPFPLFYVYVQLISVIRYFFTFFLQYLGLSSPYLLQCNFTTLSPFNWMINELIFIGFSFSKVWALTFWGEVRYLNHWFAKINVNVLKHLRFVMYLYWISISILFFPSMVEIFYSLPSLSLMFTLEESICLQFTILHPEKFEFSKNYGNVGRSENLFVWCWIFRTLIVFSSVGIVLWHNVWLQLQVMLPSISFYSSHAAVGSVWYKYITYSWWRKINKYQMYEINKKSGKTKDVTLKKIER